MKDNSVNFNADFDFGTRTSATREFASVLPIGQHIVEITDVTFEYSNGKTDENGDETYSDRMPTVVFHLKNDDGEIRYYVSTRALRRFNELDEKDLQEIDPADLGIKPATWKNMSVANKIEAAFDHYVSAEKELIAIRKTDNARPYEDKKSKRTNDMLAKLDSLIVDCGLGADVDFDPKTIKKMVVGRMVGIDVVPGLRNKKGRVMSKVAYTMSPDKVENI